MWIVYFIIMCDYYLTCGYNKELFHSASTDLCQQLVYWRAFCQSYEVMVSTMVPIEGTVPIGIAPITS